MVFIPTGNDTNFGTLATRGTRVTDEGKTNAFRVGVNKVSSRLKGVL